MPSAPGPPSGPWPVGTVGGPCDVGGPFPGPDSESGFCGDSSG